MGKGNRAKLKKEALLILLALSSGKGSGLQPYHCALIRPGTPSEEVVRLAALVSPSERQWAWQKREFIGFIHFGMGPDVRWVGTESGCGRETEWSVIPDTLRCENPLFLLGRAQCGSPAEHPA